MVAGGGGPGPRRRFYTAACKLLVTPRQTIQHPRNHCLRDDVSQVKFIYWLWHPLSMETPKTLLRINWAEHCQESNCHSVNYFILIDVIRSKLGNKCFRKLDWTRRDVTGDQTVTVVGFSTPMTCTVHKTFWDESFGTNYHKTLG